MRLYGLLALTSLASALGCQSLASPSIEYVDCLPNRDGVYEETFDRGEDPVGADRCWKTDGVMGGYITEKDEDLIIHPDGEVGASWSENEQAPFFFRSVAGDFFAITKAEATSASPGWDHCLDTSEAAGLVVRRPEPLAWVQLLVRPDLAEDELQDQTKCGDERPAPPFARVSLESHGFDSQRSDSVGGKGEDAEAYIALCRVDDQLFFFYQARVEIQDNGEDLQRGFEALRIGKGPVDVGLTATAAPGKGTLPEGHFNWLVLQDSSEDSGDICTLALETFKRPKPE
jgi:hypothetical protein